LVKQKHNAENGRDLQTFASTWTLYKTCRHRNSDCYHPSAQLSLSLSMSAILPTITQHKRTAERELLQASGKTRTAKHNRHKTSVFCLPALLCSWSVFNQANLLTHQVSKTHFLGGNHIF
jgi:hypothetical protein